MQLPAEVIATDHNLEQTAERTSTELAKHRWHWTLDESNAQRVSISEYARQIGRSPSVVGNQANGYALWLDENTSSAVADEGRPLHEHIRRANMGAETQAATEAVAKARGATFRTAKDKRPTEVRRVREIARQRAEERGTSVEEEAPKVAETIVRHEHAQQQEDAEKAERSDIRFVEMEGYLVKAKRELLKALKIATVVPWEDESRELLTETVANVKALLGLIDTALSGNSGVDWDAEFAKVANGENI